MSNDKHIWSAIEGFSLPVKYVKGQGARKKHIEEGRCREAASHFSVRQYAKAYAETPAAVTPHPPELAPRTDTTLPRAMTLARAIEAKSKVDVNGAETSSTVARTHTSEVRSPRGGQYFAILIKILIFTDGTLNIQGPGPQHQWCDFIDFGAYKLYTW